MGTRLISPKISRSAFALGSVLFLVGAIAMGLQLSEASDSGLLSVWFKPTGTRVISQAQSPQEFTFYFRLEFACVFVSGLLGVLSLAAAIVSRSRK